MVRATSGGIYHRRTEIPLVFIAAAVLFLLFFVFRSNPGIYYSQPKGKIQMNICEKEILTTNYNIKIKNVILGHSL